MTAATITAILANIDAGPNYVPPLPMDAADIVLYEQDGYVVDLETGEVTPATAEAAGLSQALVEAGEASREGVQ